MAATTCAYGYESRRGCGPLMPAARSSQIMESFDNGHAAQGAVMPPPPAPPPPPPPPPLPPLLLGAGGNPSNSKATSRRFGLCTEGLGSESSESSGDVDLGDVADDSENDANVDVGQALPCKRQLRDNEEKDKAVPPRPRGGRAFPPPISVIGAAGKPWQYLRAHRGDGRLVLREVRIPSRELLQACREDGRLKLHFAHPEEQQLVDDQCHGQEIKNEQNGKGRCEKNE